MPNELKRPRGDLLEMAAAGLIALSSFSSFACSKPSCQLDRVTVTEAPADRTGEFEGIKGRITVVFRSESKTGPVEVFPEPPVIVRDTAAGRECRIEEGGIWVRDQVYMSEDGETLALKEYNGSNDWLAFYGTVDCVKHAEIDISGGRWTMQGDRVLVGSDCSSEAIASCRSVREYVLDGACRPSVKKIGNSSK